MDSAQLINPTAINLELISVAPLLMTPLPNPRLNTLISIGQEVAGLRIQPNLRVNPGYPGSPSFPIGILEHINSHYQRSTIDEDEIAIVDDMIIEKKWGWIFIYQSKRWISNRNRSYKILGLCPVVVEKLDGSLRYLDEGISAEECILKYENRRGLNRVAIN